MSKLSIVLLLALVAVAYCQVELLNPTGRGYVIGDAGHAPCGQRVTQTNGNRVQWRSSMYRVSSVRSAHSFTRTVVSRLCRRV
jgi:hypothetical protein